MIKNPRTNPNIIAIAKTNQTIVSLTPLGMINWKNRMNTNIITQAQVIINIVTSDIF